MTTLLFEPYCGQVEFGQRQSDATNVSIERLDGLTFPPNTRVLPLRSANDAVTLSSDRRTASFVVRGNRRHFILDHVEFSSSRAALTTNRSSGSSGSSSYRAPPATNASTMLPRCHRAPASLAQPPASLAMPGDQIPFRPNFSLRLPCQVTKL